MNNTELKEKIEEILAEYGIGVILYPYQELKNYGEKPITIVDRFAALLTSAQKEAVIDFAKYMGEVWFPDRAVRYLEQYKTNLKKEGE